MTTVDLRDVEPKLVASLLDAADHLDQGEAVILLHGGKSVGLIMPLTGDPVTEYATMLGSDTMQVRPDNRYVPLADWIDIQSGAVYRRQIVVVDDWTEVSR